MSDASQLGESKFGKLLGEGGFNPGPSSQIQPDQSFQNAPESPPQESKFGKMLGGQLKDFSSYSSAPASKITQPKTTGFGAFVSGVIESVLPSAGALAGGAAGAEAGGAAGAALGALTGPAAPVVSPVLGVVGAVGGGLTGLIGGQKLVSSAQNWAVSKMPKSWQESLGQSEEQKEAYEKEHPIAHFIGGLLPFAVTMNPLSAEQKLASEGLTTFQKLAKNPLASRLVSGTVMGGFEAGTEVIQGDHPDWAKIGLSTAFGFVFNRSNRLGEAIGGIGHNISGIIPGVKGMRAPATIAEANDLHILGPGATEDVFAGQQARNPAAADTARKSAQEEMSVLGPLIEPNIHEVARKIDPETIEKYDDLQHQKNVLTDWMAEHEGAGTHESEEAQGVRQKLDTVDKQIEEIAPDRAAAYQRAADHIGPEETTVLPQEVKQVEQSPEIMAKLSPPDRPLEVQRKAISDEITSSLVKAGRPENEAQAHAALASAYYETRAARFEGNLGTAEDLYKQSFPDIQKHIESPSGNTKKDVSNGYIESLFSDKSILKLTERANPSTPIHELSHRWLVDFVKDAQHPLAPESLKNDLRTTLEYLKVKNPENVTEPQHISDFKHERWARSFEQYAREGIAPSPELASVFGKFKNWLTSVYQTLKGLGRPISPEIRGVFDRMLAQNPERTVIAPEEARQPTMSDIHEDDANHVEPHPEAPHMDLMLSEAKQTVMDLPKEVKDEIEAEFQKRLEASKPKGEGGSSTGGPTELEHGGEQPRLIPESVSSGEANGQVSGRGAQGGAGISREVSTPARQGVNELSPNTIERFNPAPGANVDKAGNIVTTNLNTTESIRNALKDFSTANGEYTELRDRRQLTEGEKIDIAGDLDLNVEKIGMIHKMSQIVSENIVAARHLIKRTASDWIAARDQALASGTDEDLLKWVETTQRHNLVQGYLSGITANSGRALAYFRRKEMGFDYGGDLNEQAKGETGKTLFQHRQDLEMSKSVDSIQKVSKFSTESTKLQWGKMPLEFMVNNLISNPITHSTYAIGNEMLKFVQSVPEKLVAAGIGEIRRSLGQERERVFAGEAGEYFTGQNLPGALKAAGEALVKGTPAELATEKLASDALKKIREHVAGKDKIASDADILNYLHETGPKQALKDLGVEVSPETMKRVEGLIRQTKENLVSMPGTELAQRPTFNEQTQWSELRPDVLGMFKGVLDGFSTSAPLFSIQHSNLGYIPEINVKGGNALPIGTLARLPSRMVSAIHTFFTATTYSVEKNSYAYRTAKNEGLTGAAYDQRVADLRQNPPADKMEEFHKAAYGTALMGEPGELTKSMTRLLNTEIGGVRPLRFIAPFNQIFSNIARKTFLERTPVGILSTSIREDLMGKNGSVAQDLAQARMMVGSALGLVAGAMYYKGVLSGSGPADPTKNRQWREAGNQAHSIRIGDMWYDIGKLGPLGKLLSMGADLADSAHVISHEGMKEGAHHIAHAASQLFIEESPFGAMSNVMKAIEDPGKHGVNYASALISNFIPYSSALYQFERYGDPYSRKANGFIEGLMKKIPGLGEELMPRRDVWGEPIENPHSFGYATSIHEVRASNDPVRVFLGSAGFNVAMPPKQIVGVPLTEDQYDDFVRISGRTAKMQLDRIVNSRDWARMPPNVKHDVFSAVISGARNAARGEIVRAHPEIIQQAVANQKKLTQPAQQEE